MSRRNWFFAVIVAVVFAADFTLAALGWVLWLFQPMVGGSGWEDPDTWVHLGSSAVLAVIFWGAALWSWNRVAADMDAT